MTFKITFQLVLVFLLSISEIAGQTDVTIHLGEDSYNRTTRNSDGSTTTSSGPVRYFQLMEEDEVNSHFGPVKQRVGFLASNLKKHLSPDAEVQALYKRFRLRNSAQFVGIPLGFAAVFVGASYEFGDHPELTEDEKTIRGYSWMGLGTVVAGVTYYISFKAWDVLDEAIGAHNNLLSSKDQSFNNFRLRPTISTFGNSFQPTLGISLNYHVKYK